MIPTVLAVLVAIYALSVVVRLWWPPPRLALTRLSAVTAVLSALLILTIAQPLISGNAGAVAWLAALALTAVAVAATGWAWRRLPHAPDKGRAWAWVNLVLTAALLIPLLLLVR